MGKDSSYVSKQPDADGIIQWTDEENGVWRDLVARQRACIEGKACDEYMRGLELLDLPADRIPQLADINDVLRRESGWEVQAVPALIPFDEFFNLLADKKFPSATFIRSRAEFDYLQEPDIFHEIFGHCAMLTDPAFAEFTHTYGKLGQAATGKDRAWLARLYWFTVEFGLMQTAKGLRIYGGGILSSPAETEYALSDVPERRVFDPIDILRTPYRIDIMQPIYFMIGGIPDLYALTQMDIMAMVRGAQGLGLHAPKFEPKKKVS